MNSLHRITGTRSLVKQHINYSLGPRQNKLCLILLVPQYFIFTLTLAVLFGNVDPKVVRTLKQHAMKDNEGVEVNIHSFLNSVLDGHKDRLRFCFRGISAV
jgi:hypothetical protein